MANCPNCGQETLRTQDWACQWCGYPLVSGSFQQISKTYQEAKAERLQEAVAVEVTGSDTPEADVAQVSEVVADTTGATVESGLPETETAGEVEQAVEVEQELKPESMPETEPAAETESIPEGEPLVEAGAAQSPDITTVTIGELNEACEKDNELAKARFTGSRLQITGEVGRIPPVESAENPCLILVDPEKPTSRNVLCVFDKQREADINKLSVGQTVTVQGNYDGCIINILVTDCVLVD